MKAEFPETLAGLFKPCRYKILYSGRGAGKSWAVARWLLIEGAKRKIRVLCARETMKSLEDSVHTLLSDQIEALGLQSRYEVQRATIIGKNGTEFIFAGLRQNAANLKSYESCTHCWVEEAASVSKASWEILIPTIRAPQSEIIVTFNPELDTDDTYRRFVLNPPPDSWVCNTSWRDNPWFPEVLEVERKHLEDTDIEQYRHVWEGACRSAVSGAIYGMEMKKVAEEGRICQVPYDRTKPVDTAWDLGYGDKTAIWFVQAYGGFFNFIDYIEDSGETIHSYLIQLQNKGYRYGNFYLPHDALDTIIHGKLAAERERSIEGIIRQAGYSIRMVPKTFVVDQINAARTVFPLCRFDEEKCADGIRALRMFQWGPPAKSGALKREPLHDNASHAASAFGYAAWSVKQQPGKLPSKPSGKPRLSPASAWS